MRTSTARIPLWIITLFALINLAGCYPVGHDQHGPQEHRQAMKHLQEPNHPSD